MVAISPSTRHEIAARVGELIWRRNHSQQEKSWEQQRHPPVPLSRRSHATVRFKRCASPKMAGTLAIRQKWLLPTRSIHDGGTARSSSTGEAKLLLSSLASGPKNSTTGSSRKCGHSRETALPCALLTSGTTTRITGIAPTEMKTGNSGTMASWLHGLHPSTTFPFWNQSANITGRSGGVPMTTQG